MMRAPSSHASTRRRRLVLPLAAFLCLTLVLDFTPHAWAYAYWANLDANIDRGAWPYLTRTS
jgi:hypothetical protein